jgi:regulator of nonsense transcripts 1
MQLYCRHEHIYEIIQGKLIRSDELPGDPGDLEQALGGTCIMLSTLSMLSNPTLDDKNVFEIVPVVQLVIDEASQINLFDFMVRTARSHLFFMNLHLFVSMFSRNIET